MNVLSSRQGALPLSRRGPAPAALPRLLRSPIVCAKDDKSGNWWEKGKEKADKGDKADGPKVR